MNNNSLSFLDFLTLVAFIVGVYSLLVALQNLEENRIQTLDTKEVLDKLNNHLHEQDKHLEAQDKLLVKEG